MRPRSTWEVIRIFLLIWLGLFVLLCAISLVKNWALFIAMLQGNLTGMISSIVIVAFVVFIFFALLGGLF